MNNLESVVMKKTGTDINSWMQPIQASIPRTIIVNIDELGLSARQIKQESGLSILCRLMVDKVYGRKTAPVSNDALDMIKPLIDPSIIVMVPHHMAKRLFALSDEDLKVLRIEEIVEYQEVSSTFVYHWDMLRSEWMGGTFKLICH
ncbi:MAG: hypothetical protein LAT80_00815 [Balneolaceae bacterium]|nr:hypothetical protein [Balneolaceae bacterium]